MKYQVKQSFEDVVRDYEEAFGTLSEDDRNELRRVYEAAARTLEHVLETKPVSYRNSQANLYVLDGRFYAAVRTWEWGLGETYTVDGVDELEYPCDADYMFILTCDVAE